MFNAEYIAGINDKGIYAHIIKDSLIAGVRVCTLEVCFPRFILPEFNTHRVFSRNSASSRARSVKRSFLDVYEHPFCPQPFTRNQKGMSGSQSLTEHEAQQARDAWMRARNAALISALDMLVGQPTRMTYLKDSLDGIYDLLNAYDMQTASPSIHKQHVNRILEPFMYHTAIISSTEWDNFYDLRLKDDVQPEMRELTECMKYAMDTSTPQDRLAHLPYIDNDELSRDSIMRSVASCASISYKAPHELQEGAVQRIFESMAAHKHLSPFEHVACTCEALPDVLRELNWLPTANLTQHDLHGNFRPDVVQLRKVLELCS